MLGPEVVRVRCHTGLDNSDEPAIYVYVVLTDEASRRDVWGEAAPRVRRTLWDELKPFENWGRRLYISFRSHSEYIQMNDPLW